MCKDGETLSILRGPAALRALCAARRLALHLDLMLRGSLGGGGGRRLLAAGGRDAAQLLPRHVGGAVRLDALGALRAQSAAGRGSRSDAREQ